MSQSLANIPCLRTATARTYKKRASVSKFWFEKLQKEAHTMFTLSFWDIEKCMPDSLHPIWGNLYRTTDVKKAFIKARLLVQIYRLATSYMAGHKKQDIGPLCKADRETQ